MSSQHTPGESHLPVPREHAARRIAAPPARPHSIPNVPEPPGLTPAFILWVFRHWWKIVLPVGVVLAAVAAAVVLQTHVPMYEASSLIMIQHAVPFVAFEQKAGPSDKFVQTQLELLRSVVLRTALEREEIGSLPELQDEADPEAHLVDNLSITQVGDSELYEVAYSSPSPKSAMMVANSIVLEYLEMQMSDAVARSQLVINLLEDERRLREARVEQLRQRLLNLTREATGKDPFGNQPFTDVDKAFSPITSLHEDLTNVEIDIALKEVDLKAAKNAPLVLSELAEETGALDLAVNMRPEVKELGAEITEIQTAIDSLKAALVNPANNDDFKRLQKLLVTRQESLDELKSNLREQTRIQFEQERESTNKSEVASIEQELERLKKKKEFLDNRYDEHVRELQDGGAATVHIEFAKSELAREEQVFELIAERKLALQTEQRAPPRVRMRLEAELPRNPIEAIPYKLLVIGCLPAFFAPFALAVGKEMLVRRITDCNQLIAESKLHVLGEVARFPVRPVASTPSALPSRLRREMYIFAESIDSLRTNLFLSAGFGKGQALVVTSAAAGEGKTSVATALAVSIAGATKKKTLVIDADLRSPDVDGVLGVKSQPGLAEVLSGNCSLEQAIHQVGSTNTFVMPAGRAKANPHHLVQPEKVSRLLEKLRTSFATIVIDTPPVLGASESLVFAKAADGVLFCSLCDVSRAHQVRVAVDRLQHSHVNVLGAVLGGTPISRYSYVYGYYSNPAEIEART